MQTLADQTGLSITVAHLPPGTCQWNRIEHQLFAFITQNRRGTSLRTYPDANGNIVQVNQSGNGTVLQTSSQTYTLTGKVATSTDPNGGVTYYVYDGVDRLTSVRDAVGRVTLYGYDALGRRSSVSNPAVQAGPLQATQYTLDGFTASLTDANGRVLAYVYDGFDRLSSTTYPATAAVGTTTEVFTYDADGNVQTRKTRKGDMISFAYDTLNRLTRKNEPSGTPSVTYAYNLAGRVVSVSDNGPTLVTVSQTTGFTTNASDDALNRPTSVTWGSVAAQTPPAAPASVTFTRQYDPTNLRIRQAANDSTWLAYPGPASTTAYTANSLNQYSQVGPVTPAYDANGNLTFDGTFTYGYDAESRLVSVSQGGAAVASYAYDGRGRRKSRTVGATTTVTITGAEDQEVAEYNGTTGAAGAFYAFNLGGGIDEVLNRAVPGGARQTLLPDIQGSIIASLDSGGALTKVSYQAFGESATAVSSGAGPRYTGRRLDPETAIAGGAQTSGLYYYRARAYSPVLGRFLQPDPVGSAGGVNLYAYVGNDPLNATDPSGLFCNAMGASVTCTGQTGSTISFPRPAGWPDTIDGSNPNYHSYNVAVNAGSVGRTPLLSAIAQNPTAAAYNNPASIRGSLNDATPFVGGGSPVNISPVISYLTKDTSGNVAVVNVTQPGHPLFPGYVARSLQPTSSGLVVNNVGEGSGWLQGSESPVASDINNVWHGQTQG